MNAETGEPTPKPAEPLTPGALLRGERERRSITLQQAAEDLHLDTWAVEALESNRFSAFGAPVYAKGHLRKYALLLGLTPERVIHGYEQMSDAPPPPTPIPQTVNAPPLHERRSLQTPLLVLVGVAALALAAWLISPLLNTTQEPESPPIAMSPAPPAPSQPAATSPEAISAPQPAVETPAPDAQTPPPVVAAPAARVADPPATPSAEAAQVRLRLEFSGESWTEVYDAGGKRLMFGVGAPGRARDLVGAAPLHVTIGAADAVSAAVNDEPVVIPRRQGRDAARFTVDAAGAVKPAGARKVGE